MRPGWVAEAVGVGRGGGGKSRCVKERGEERESWDERGLISPEM